MSRIGKLPINLPAGVSVTVNKDNSVVVKGPKGELTQQIDAEIKVSVEETKIVLERPSNQKRHKAMHGLYRSLVNNMVIGVTEGYKIEQELVGVGYRATSKGQLLELALGYSHLIHMEIAPEVKVTAVTEKRSNPIITLESCDKHLVGQVAAKIRSFRKPEPYKGKGIKFVGEQLRRKAGKSAGK
jgi:large subunit ribosomal protein L6